MEHKYPRVFIDSDENSYWLAYRDGTLIVGSVNGNRPQKPSICTLLEFEEALTIPRDSLTELEELV